MRVLPAQWWTIRGLQLRVVTEQAAGRNRDRDRDLDLDLEGMESGKPRRREPVHRPIPDRDPEPVAPF